MPLAGRARLASRLVEQFGADTIAKVPGLIQRQSDHRSYWTLAGPPGLLIPVRDLDGAIVSLIVRLDNFEGSGKYRWLSSRYHGGPGPLTSCHIPLYDGSTHIIRLAEGALKADVATSLSGVLTLGISGVGPWKLALPVLKVLRPETVLLAWDADWRCNPNVARSLGNCAKALHKLGFHVLMESWCSTSGKGIDDLLANGYQPERKGLAACYAAQQRGTALRSAPRLGDLIKQQMENRYAKNDSAT